MERLDVLNNYLFLQKRISIPGLGTLHMERLPARTDFVNTRILSPVYRFRFDQYFDAPDKDLFGYLSSRLGVPDFEAIKWYNEFAYSLRAKIRANEVANWPGLGNFMADEKGEISFETAVPGFELPAPVTANRVIRENSDHAVLVGDRELNSADLTEQEEVAIYVERGSWWIAALILAAIAISLAVFHFYRQDAGVHTSGNQQKIPVYPMPSTSRTLNL
ncbi:hypothetical protein [Flavihumibacter sp. CACIAM 22H1]|uniref:hypothetical protein n=1 Tax=Flavihumibacter sp. CACIAM 22H1 TaxID=1812911 RepID=UPI0007A85634|nr:hypothetical protein [Flavihumibacter sp. CACIAM 22H1]KYP14932.1 MAG: hypothetical protein A1D16_03450 [Flavihumibacter sp. CACIAM 22H1]